MKEQLEQRLQQLKEEFESGQKQLTDLEARKTRLQETMLRISGAIQVLEEELGRDKDFSAPDEVLQTTEPALDS